LAETLPVGVGMFPLGITFGLLVVQSGLAWWWTPIFSGLIYAGSLEFLLVGLVVVVTPLPSLALTTLLVNSRHLFYGLSFPLHRVRGRLAKAYAMFALIDEAYALTAARAADSLSSKRILWTQAFLQSYWVGGGLAGAVVGGWLPSPIRGLDFALIALFTVLALETCRKGQDLPGPVLAVGCAVVARLVVPDATLVVAMALYVLGLLARYRFTDRAGADGAVDA
jgi:4-azaleucine resistance transporter AzlC